MHFLCSFVLATALHTAQLSSAAVITPKPSSSSSAAPTEFPNFPFSNTTVQNISSFLSIVVAIPDDVLASDESLAEYFTEQSTCRTNHIHIIKRKDAPAKRPGTHPKKKREQPKLENKRRSTEPINIKPANIEQGKKVFSYLGFGGKRAGQLPQPTAVMKLETSMEKTIEKNQGSKGFRFPGFSGKKPGQEPEKQPEPMAEMKLETSAEKTTEVKQTSSWFKFPGASGKKSEQEPEKLPGQWTEVKPEAKSEAKPASDQGSKGFGFLGFSGKKPEQKPEPEPELKAGNDQVQEKKGGGFFGFGKPKTTAKSPEKTNDITTGVPQATASAPEIPGPTMTSPATPPPAEQAPPPPPAPAPVPVGQDPADPSAPSPAGPTQPPTPTSPTESHQITGLIAPDALPKIRAAIANHHSRTGDAESDVKSDDEVDPIYAEATAAIGSLIAPFASAVIDKLEHKITAAPPSATGLAGDIQTAVPAFNDAIAKFLDGLVLKRRDERKPKCIEAENVEEGIKECVDALATSPASKELVALKAAVVGAGGLAKVEAGVVSLTLEHQILSVLKKVVELGKEVEVCQFLA